MRDVRIGRTKLNMQHRILVFGVENDTLAEVIIGVLSCNEQNHIIIIQSANEN